MSLSLSEKLFTRGFISLQTILTLTGMVYQEYLISNLYFSYETTTGVEFYLPETNKAQAVSLCIRYTDILEFERLNHFPSRRDWKYSVKDEDLKRYQQNLTIAEAFEYTPHVSTVIESVIFHTKDSYELQHLNGSQVYEVFEARKFMYHEFICYMILKKDESDQSIPYNKLAFSPVLSPMIYSISLTDVLKRADVIKIVVHLTEKSPYRSLMVTPAIRRFYNDSTKTSNYNRFTVYQRYFAVYNLPPPYQSQCFDYFSINLDSRVHCVEECLRMQVNLTLGMMPFTYMIRDGQLDQHVVTYVDVEQDNISRILFNIEEHCMEVECTKIACEEKSSSTQHDDVAAETFIIRQVLPEESWQKVQLLPVLTFLDYFTYVTSVISTYTGISLIGLNSHNFYARFKVWRKKRLVKKKIKICPNHTLIIMKHRIIKLSEQLEDTLLETFENLPAVLQSQR